MVCVSVSLAICWYNIHCDQILLGQIGAVEADSEGRKHTTTGLGDDHLSTKLMESLPQIIRLQEAFYFAKHWIISLIRLDLRLSHRGAIILIGAVAQLTRRG